MAKVDKIAATIPFDTDEIDHRQHTISIQATKRVLAPYVKARKKPKLVRQENKYFSFFVQRKPSILLTDTHWLFAGNDLFEIIDETVEVMKEATKSAAATAYIVDDAVDEIFQLPKDCQNDYRISYKIEIGKTVAAYVAATKEFVLINDLLEDIRFPDGLGNSGTKEPSVQEVTVKAVMCVPVLTPNGDCIAVFQFHRNYNEPVFDDGDLSLVIVFSSWIGSTIYQNQQRITLQKQQELNEYLVEISKCYFSDTDLLDILITEIVNFAKDVSHAEHGVFYVLVTINHVLCADIWEEKEEDSDIVFKRTRRKVITDKNEVLSIVVNKGVTLNIKNAYFDPRVSKKNKKGYIVTSVLCTPIKVMDEVLGAIKLMNKKKGGCFTKSDEVLFQTFSAYSGYVLSYNKLHRKMKRTSNLNNVYLEMLSHHMLPCVHDTYFVTVHRHPPEIPQKFTQFSYYVSESYEDFLPQFIMYMINEIIPNRFETNLLIKFVLTVQKCHKNRPYLNFLHTFYTVHFVYNILRRNMDVFSRLEMTALLIAALCCTMDEYGLSDNTFQLSNHDLYQLYEENIIENHSYHVAVFVMKFLKIFENVPPDDYKKFLKEVNYCIIATDLSLFLNRRNKMNNLCDDHKYNIKSEEHRYLLKSMIMAMAFMSPQCKPFNIAKHAVENACKEKDEENLIIKQKGLCPVMEYGPEYMEYIPKDQITFLNTMIIPTTIIINKVLPTCQMLFKDVMRLKDAWQETQDTQGQKLWLLEESIPRKLE